MSDADGTERLLDQVAGGNRAALDELLSRHRELVRRFIDLRLDDGLRGRVDASDVIQEAQLEIARRMPDYLRRRPMPYHLWLRKTAHERLIWLRRRHLGAARRDAQREVILSEESSRLLAAQLRLARGEAPEGALQAEESAQRVRAALAQLGDVDREVLLLRFFDGLSNAEVAQVLELEAAAARKRYGRALLRLRRVLEPGAEDAS